MEVITQREEVEASDSAPKQVASLDFSATHNPPAFSLSEKVERVAPWLVNGCMKGLVELDTRNNLVHAYVEAYYMPPDSV